MDSARWCFLLICHTLLMGGGGATDIQTDDENLQEKCTCVFTDDQC